MNESKYETLYDGTKIPVLGLGTWRMGGGMVSDRSRDSEYVDAIRTAVEMGYTHIDTAEIYGAGHTEELVGEAIAPFPREDLFITTKVARDNLAYRDVLDAFKGSLKRLRIDYVDMYLIHWPNPRVPLQKTFRALNELAASGRAKRLGVSNFDLDRLQRAQALSEVPIATDQVEYNVLSRRPGKNGVLDHCQTNNILLTAYSPLGKGNVLNHPKLKEIGEKYGATPAQIALAWLIRQPKVITIPKSANEEHLKENVAALEIELSEEDVERLDRLR